VVVESCSYTLSHGATPGQAALTLGTVFDGLAGTGMLVITDGIGTIALRGCKIDKLSFLTGPSGSTVQLLILDRRWQWAFPTIRGRYNTKDDKGKVVKARERTPKQLAELCLKAMGERNYRIIGLPSDARPEVAWDAENAAQALQSLVEPLGCRLIYQPNTDSVLIAPLGEGAQLPAAGSFADDQPGLDLPELPDELEVLGAEIKYQVRLKLEAVGEDFDGALKPLDKLSYKPLGADGWGRTNPPMFANLPADDKLPGEHKREEALAQARKSVYRYYRVKECGPDGSGKVISIPTYDDLERGRSQVILTDRKNDTKPDDAGNPVAVPAQVFGAYYRGGPATANTDKKDPVKVPFQVDSERGLVIFDSPVYELDSANGKVKAADLTFEGAVLVRGNDSDMPLRYSRKRKTGARNGTAAATVLREDVELKKTTAYHPATQRPTKTTDNAKEADRIADYYLDGELRQYVASEAADRTYNGIVPVMCDGAIQQVTWAVGPGGVTTRASRNSEHAVFVPPYPQRRKAEVDLEELARRKQQAEALRQRFAERPDVFQRPI
jgi:hypothetical protein